MKKLYEVTMEKTIYVLADDDREAEIEAKTWESEEEPDNLTAREITSTSQVPREFMDTLPYGEDDGQELTIAQILELPLPPAPYVDPPEQLRFEFPGGALA